MSRGSLRPLSRVCLILALAGGVALTVEAGTKELTAEQIKTAMDKARFLQDALSAHLDSNPVAERRTVIVDDPDPSHERRVNKNARAAHTSSRAAGIPRRHDREAFAARRAQDHARRSLQRVDHLLTIADAQSERDPAGSLRRIEQAVFEVEKVQRRLGIDLVTEIQQEVQR